MSRLSEQLFAAIESGKVDEVATLLKNGAKIDTKDAQGRTALIKTASLGKIHIIKVLLAKKAKIDVKDGSGWAPLVHTFAKFRLDGAKLLMSKGAKASVADKYICSALNLMMKLGDKKTARHIDANLTE